MDPITIGYVMAAIAGAGAAYQSKESADYQGDMLEKQAEDEELQARERELVRKQKINKVLAAQIAGLGASGISAEGTPQLIAQKNIAQESLDGLASQATRSGRESGLLNQAAASRKLGSISAATSLLNTGTNAYLGYKSNN